MSINRENIENIVSLNYNWVSGRASSQMGGRDVNQDCWGAVDTPHGFLVVVCDGMGGGQAGEVASKIAVDTILSTVKDAPTNDNRKNIVAKAIRKANEAIMERAFEDPAYRGMGTTCIVLLINDYSAIAAYVGDSRIYQLEGHRKKWRTFDHSMVFRLVKQGVITEEQARLSAQSNVITRALGIKADVQIDIVELPFEKGDRFVLTTDGIHGVMPEPKLIERLTNHKVPVKSVLDDFVKEVEAIGITNGGRHDNHTIAIVDVKKKSIYEEKMSKKSKQIIISLAVLLCISLVCNIVQCTRHNGQGDGSSKVENIDSASTEENFSEDVSENSVIGEGTQAGNSSDAPADSKAEGSQKDTSHGIKANSNKTKTNAGAPAHRDNNATNPSVQNPSVNDDADSQENPLQKTLDNNKIKLEKTAAAKEKAENAKKK